jgi:hypothetical protein
VSSVRRRQWVAGPVLALIAVVVLGGCGGTSSEDREPVPAASELDATAGQFRFDEGTRNVPTGITNNSSKPITVTSARISWDGFRWATVKLPKDPVLPRQTAAFVSHFGRASCTGKPSAPRLTAVINGVRRDLPLHLDQPGLFDRLRTSACEQQRLTDAASLTMTISRTVVTDGGVPYFAATVALRRPRTPGEQVTVVDLGGSVLFNVLPREGRRLRPVRLLPEATSLTVPIRVGPTQRCSAHARGNASQPFLFSVFTRTGDDPVHRTITVPDKATQLRLLGLLDRYCARFAHTDA